MSLLFLLFFRPNLTNFRSFSGTQFPDIVHLEKLASFFGHKYLRGRLQQSRENNYVVCWTSQWKGHQPSVIRSNGRPDSLATNVHYYTLTFYSRRSCVAHSSIFPQHSKAKHVITPKSSAFTMMIDSLEWLHYSVTKILLLLWDTFVSNAGSVALAPGCKCTSYTGSMDILPSELMLHYPYP